MMKSKGQNTLMMKINIANLVSENLDKKKLELFYPLSSTPENLHFACYSSYTTLVCQLIINLLKTFLVAFNYKY